MGEEASSGRANLWGRAILSRLAITCLTSCVRNGLAALRRPAEWVVLAEIQAREWTAFASVRFIRYGLRGPAKGAGESTKWADFYLAAALTSVQHTSSTFA